MKTIINQRIFCFLVLILWSLSFQSCQKEPLPISMTITTIEVIRYPALNGNAGWDIATKPDLYAAVLNSGISTKVTATKLNASTPVVLPLTDPYTVTSLNTRFSIGIYDEDDFESDDYIGSVGFFPSQYASDAPTSFRVAEGQIEYRLTVEWEFK